MIAIDLTIEERISFQYIVPVQGSLETLELVDTILKKVRINDSNEKTKKISFDLNEILFLQKMIKFLDSQKKLSFEALSLIKKIMNIKGEIKHE